LIVCSKAMEIGEVTSVIFFSFDSMLELVAC
jgi:hypothetical protein